MIGDLWLQAALKMAREALEQAPADAAAQEEEAREAERFLEVEQQLAQAERQMAADDFTAAAVTLRKALCVDNQSVRGY